MARSRKHELGVGLLLAGALALLAFMSLQVGALQGLGQDRIEVRVRLSDAAGLAEGAAVKVAGVDVGEISRLGIEGDKALLVVQLDVEAGLRKDAVAQVRARSVLGEKYLALEPRSAEAPPLVEGDVLSESLPQTEIDQLVNALGPVVAELDTQALNAALQALSRATAEDPERLSRILKDSEEAVHNLAVASRSLAPLADEAQATLREVREVSRELRPVLRRADGALTRLDEATRGLPATAEKVELLVDETRLAVADGRRLVTQLEGSTGDLEAVLHNFKEIDKTELRRLLREEGILVRVRESTVEPPR